MRLETRDAFKFLAGGVLALALLAWVFRGADRSEVLGALGRASWGGVLACAALQFSHTFVRVERWGVLLRPIRRRVPFGSMWIAVILGYLVTWVLPGRLGELVRPALLSGREQLPLAPAIGTVVADRLLDALAILALFAGGLWWTPLAGGAAEHARMLRGGALALLPLALGGLAGLALLARARGPAERWIARRGRGLGRLGRIALDVAEGSRALASPVALARVALSSAAMWLAIAAGLWVGFAACGAPIPFGGVLVLLPAIALGVALPTPGGVGGFHAAVTFGLTQIFAVERAAAVGAALLVHLASVVPVLLLGGALIALGTVPPAHLRRIVEQARALGREKTDPVGEGSA